jgi:hypothetical protein
VLKGGARGKFQMFAVQQRSFKLRQLLCFHWKDTFPDKTLFEISILFVLGPKEATGIVPSLTFHMAGGD